MEGIWKYFEPYHSTISFALVWSEMLKIYGLWNIRSIWIRFFRWDVCIGMFLILFRLSTGNLQLISLSIGNRQLLQLVFLLVFDKKQKHSMLIYAQNSHSFLHLLVITCITIQSISVLYDTKYSYSPSGLSKTITIPRLWISVCAHCSTAGHAGEFCCQDS